MYSRRCGAELTVAEAGKVFEYLGGMKKALTKAAKILGWAFLVLIVLGAVLLIVVVIHDDHSSAVPASQTPANRQLKDSFMVGVWNYAAMEVKRVEKLEVHDEYRRPKADSFLLVELWVENEGKVASYVPAIKLVDKQGREYVQSNEAIYLKHGLSPVTEFNPAVGEIVTLVFDVPSGRSYALKVSGGDDQSVLIELPEEVKSK
jgi:Domain of unknown function (DUF4352)